MQLYKTPLFIIKIIFYNLIFLFHKKESPYLVRFLFWLALFIMYFKLGNSKPFFENSSITFEKLDFLIRFIIFSVPATITVYFFTYKERKEAFHSSVKSSFVGAVFFYQLSLSIFALICLSHVYFVYGAKDYNINQFMFSFVITILSITFMFIFIFILLKSKDGLFNLLILIHVTKLRSNAFKFGIMQGKYIFFDPYDFIQNYNNGIEAQYQIISSNLKTSSYLEIEHYYLQVFENSIDIFSNVINPVDFDNLYYFFNKNNDQSNENSSESKDQEIGKSKKNQNQNENQSIEKSILRLYKLILVQSKQLINESIIHKFTSLNSEFISNFIRYAPFNFQESDSKLDEEELKVLLRYQDELIKTFFGALFETVQLALKDEKLDYSFLIQEYYKTSNRARSLVGVKGKDDLNSPLVKITKNINDRSVEFETSLAMWSMEQDRLKALTESTILILRNSRVTPEKNYIKGMRIVSKFLKFPGLKERYNDVLTAKKLFQENIMPTEDYLFKLLLIVIKGHELGNYACVGYLTKVIVSNFEIKEIQEAFKQVFDKYKHIIKDEQKAEYNPIEFKTSYYHSILHEFSFKYCFMKTSLLFAIQIGFRYEYRKEDMEIEKYFDNVEDLILHRDKLLAAGNKYGLLSVDKINNDNINKLFN